MTRAVFLIKDSDYIGFSILGHSGFSAHGTDILCSAISAMTMLVANTICVTYNQKAKINTNRENTKVYFELKKKDKAATGLIKGFYNELVFLSKKYPENLKVYKIFE